jgi:hypothetical protein
MMQKEVFFLSYLNHVYALTFNGFQVELSEGFGPVNCDRWCDFRAFLLKQKLISLFLISG